MLSRLRNARGRRRPYRRPPRPRLVCLLPPGDSVIRREGAMSIDLTIRGAATPNAAHLLWDSAERHSDRLAIVERDSTVRYTTLRDRAAAFATGLWAAGVEANDRVALLLERGWDAAAAFFGTLAAGAIAVVVSDTLRPRQIEHMLAHSGARCLVTTADLLARQPHRLSTDATILDAGAMRHSAGSRAVALEPAAAPSRFRQCSAPGAPGHDQRRRPPPAARRSIVAPRPAGRALVPDVRPDRSGALHVPPTRGAGPQAR